MGTKTQILFGRLFLLFLAMALLLLYHGSAFSKDYPTKPINLLIPYSPGGPTDVSARVLAEVAQEMLGQPVIVVNTAGGGGIIAQSLVAKEKPDGYNLAITSNRAFIQIPQMRNVTYDPLKDFEYIFGHMGFPVGMACRAEKPWKSYKDLIVYSKQHPGKVSYGVSGKGGGSHIDIEIVQAKEGVTWQMVPFAGDTKTVAALLGGHVDFAHSSCSIWMPHVKTGEVRALAVDKSQKELYPDAVTFEELGLEEDGVGRSLFGIIAPKGTPAEIVKKLQEVFRKATEDPRFDTMCKKLGIFKESISGEELFRIMKRQYNVRGEVIKRLGLAKK
jgi:tripartite-type tricarboxylate transporter receptor subunit TctC